MASIGSFVLSCITYIPCIASGIFLFKNAQAHTVESLMLKYRLPVDSRLQTIFNECVTECGLNPDKYVCKLGLNRRLPTAYAVFPNGVIISDLAEKTFGNESVLRYAIKHELGHLTRYDDVRVTCISFVATVALFGIARMMEKYLQGRLMGTIAIIAATCIQLPLLFEIQRFVRLKMESYADQFAIKHMTKSQDLQSVSSYYKNKFESWVEKLPNFRGGQSAPMEAFQNRKNQQQTLREWVIENRSMPLAAGESPMYPNWYDRAETFRLAAERLEPSN